MPWTPPKTWQAGEVVTDAMLNTHLRDNLLYLHDNAAKPRLFSIYGLDGDAWAIPTGDLQYRPIDFVSNQTRLNFTLPSGYHDLVISFTGTFKGATGGTWNIRARLNGTSQTEHFSEDGNWQGCHCISCTWPFIGIGSGSHYAEVLFAHNGNALSPGIGTRYLIIQALPR